MSADHPQYADWDAAYVLGALSPSDRRAFEAHLEQCRLCRDAIAEIAGTLGLMARIEPERAATLLDPADTEDGPDPGRRDRIVESAARHARRRRAMWWGGGIAAAAAVLAVVVIAVTTAIGPGLRAVQVIALDPVVAVPLTASVELSDVAWGTRIDMVCEYEDEPGSEAPAEGWPYVLVVTATDGTTSELSTWRAAPGSTARLSAGTALEVEDIASIEIRTIDGQRVLLRGEVDDPDR